MKENWMLSEAVEAINSGDAVKINEVAGRYPVASILIAKACVSSYAVELLKAVPNIVTMEKVEEILKSNILVQEDAGEGSAAKAGEPAGIDFESLEEKSIKQLIELCESHGIKVLKAGRNKQYYITQLRNNIKTDDVAQEEPEEDEPEAAVQENDEIMDYDSMTAVELFKLCKKRGIDVKPRGKADVYIKMLKKKDEEESSEKDAGWGDDSEEDTDAKSEDDEWDI